MAAGLEQTEHSSASNDCVHIICITVIVDDGNRSGLSICPPCYGIASFATCRSNHLHRITTRGGLSENCEPTCSWHSLILHVVMCLLPLMDLRRWECYSKLSVKLQLIPQENSELIRKHCFCIIISISR